MGVNATTVLCLRIVIMQVGSTIRLGAVHPSRVSRDASGDLLRCTAGCCGHVQQTWAAAPEVCRGHVQTLPSRAPTWGPVVATLFIYLCIFTYGGPPLFCWVGGSLKDGHFSGSL